MNSIDLPYFLGMAGTVAFAVTAVLAVIPKGIDLFGACVMGIITAVGGGTIRVVILDVEVFWATDLNYIWVALVSSVIAFYGNRLSVRCRDRPSATDSCADLRRWPCQVIAPERRLIASQHGYNWPGFWRKVYASACRRSCVGATE